MKSWKIGTKLLFFVVSVTFVLITTLIVVNVGKFKNLTKMMLGKQSEEVAYRYANKIMGEFDKTLVIARSTAYAISGLKEEGNINREDVLSILKSVAKNNECIAGIFAVFEPNSIGGNDSRYIGRKGSDETGRFVPFFKKFDNKINFDLVKDYHENDSGNKFYMYPKNTGNELIDNPVIYPLGNSKKLVTAYVVPIKENGKFMGVVATIIDLGIFQDLIEKNSLEETGFAFFVANNGLTVAHPEINGESMVGKNFFKVLYENGDNKYKEDAIKEGKFLVTKGVNLKNGKTTEVIYTPIKIGDTNTPWSLCVVMPTSILEQVNRVQWFSIIFSVIILFVLGGVIHFLISKIVARPLLMISDYASKIARGDLDFYIEIDREDEIGTLANSFRSVQETSEDISKLIAYINGEYNKGNLKAKFNTSQFKGEWKDLIDNVLKTFNSVIIPVRESIRVLGKIKRGDLRENITMEVNGDFNELKDAVNGVHAGLSFIIQFSKKIANGDMEIDIFKASNDDQIHEWLVLMRDNIKHIVYEVNKFGEFSSKGDFDNISFENKDANGVYEEIFNNLTKTVKAIKDPLNEVNFVMGKMANRDLSVKVEGDYEGLFRGMKRSINDFTDAINKALSQVAASTDEINIGSSKISGASQSLKESANKQAEAVDELTKTMTEISSQTRANAENANMATKLAVEAKKSADSGNKRMDEMAKAMNEISESSQEIKKVIKVIDDIAFQTNLLALNAAVEAARAGAHGKGFAVVADEVRNLAQRSAEAAKETTELIELSNKRVEKGSDISMETMRSLEEISLNITKTVDLVEEIAISSEDQARGIEQSNDGLSRVSIVTQQNVNMAEDTAGVSVELTSQAENLKNMISSFRLDSSDLATKNIDIRVNDEFENSSEDDLEYVDDFNEF
ncbi:MAG: hypothetical protein CR982_00670 [Candidatus Cloacimonadota bacterium]|nr:MAG: hypothetical protein CR982_00670 [Candidatus Cloacimonadota bacterium]PIE78444.1 MAG: hypothetical protein CSA15_07845 [Candidatus Delongbacteria bacterium]